MNILTPSHIQEVIKYPKYAAKNEQVANEEPKSTILQHS